MNMRAPHHHRILLAAIFAVSTLLGAFSISNRASATSVEVSPVLITQTSAQFQVSISGYPPGGVAIVWGENSNTLSNTVSVPFCQVDPCVFTLPIGVALTPNTKYFYQAKNATDGTSYKGVNSFTTLKSELTIVAESITQTSATLKVTASDDITSGDLKWGTDPENLDHSQTIGFTTFYSLPIGPLSPGTTYHYALYKNGTDEKYANMLAFTTPKSSLILSAENITAVGVDIVATVSPDIIHAEFRLDETSSHIASSPSRVYSIPAFDSEHMASWRFEGLSKKTKYFYALYNQATGTIVGEIKSFTTTDNIVEVTATDITETGANLTIFASGDLAAVNIRWGKVILNDTSGAYEEFTAPLEPGQDFSIIIPLGPPELLLNTKYFYAAYDITTDVRYGDVGIFETGKSGTVGEGTANEFTYSDLKTDPIGQTTATISGKTTGDASQMKIFISSNFTDSLDFSSHTPTLGSGTFSIDLTGLKPSTLYYFYIANTIAPVGTPIKFHSFQTKNIFVTVDSLEVTSTKATLKASLSDGISAVKIVWGKDYHEFTTEALPTVTNGGFTYVFGLNTPLTPDTNYYYAIVDPTDIWVTYYPVTLFHTLPTDVYIPPGGPDIGPVVGGDGSLSTQGLGGGGIVPCQNLVDRNGVTVDPCNFPAFIKLIQNVMNFLIFDLALPLAALIFAYAGFLYLTSGANEHNRSKAKGIFWKVLVGFIIALSAWLIVKAVMMGLGYDTGTFYTFY